MHHLKQLKLSGGQLKWAVMEKWRELPVWHSLQNPASGWNFAIVREGTLEMRVWDYEQGTFVPVHTSEPFATLEEAKAYVQALVLLDEE